MKAFHVVCNTEFDKQIHIIEFLDSLLLHLFYCNQLTCTGSQVPLVKEKVSAVKNEKSKYPPSLNKGAAAGSLAE